MARKPIGQKVTPLKTVAQLKAEFALVQEEVALLREQNTRLLQVQVSYVTILHDVMDIVRDEPELPSTMPWGNWLATHWDPAASLRACVRATKSKILYNIIERINREAEKAEAEVPSQPPTVG